MGDENKSAAITILENTLDEIRALALEYINSGDLKSLNSYLEEVLDPAIRRRENLASNTQIASAS